MYTSDTDGGSVVTTTLNIGPPSNGSSYAKVVDYSYGGTLEMKNWTHCSELPPDDSLEFTDIALYDISGTQISSPSWSYTVWDYLDGPQCLGSVSYTSSTVTLSWDHAGCDAGKIDCGSGNPPSTRCISQSQHCP